jgi:hypothetical protein
MLGALSEQSLRSLEKAAWLVSTHSHRNGRNAEPGLRGVATLPRVANDSQ